MIEYNDDNFENYIDVPQLNDSDSLPVIIQNISIISDAIDKCEKMLQQVAIGNYSMDFQRLMSQHIRLTAQRNKFVEKKKQVEGDNGIGMSI